MNEEGANLKRPHLHGSVLSSILNLFIIERAIELKLDGKTESIFKVSKLCLNIMSLISSSTCPVTEVNILKVAIFHKIGLLHKKKSVDIFFLCELKQ